MPDRRFTDEEELEISKIYLSGKSARNIARIYELSTHTAIIAALRRTNTKQRSPSDRNRLYTLNPYVFDVINEQSAYWWGFIYADGYIYRRTLTMRLSAKDKNHLYPLRDFMQSNSPIHDVETSVLKSTNKTYKISRIEFTSEYLKNRLQQLGVVTGRTNFQHAIQHLPISMRHHWIRGLFDGDGSIDFKKSCGQPRVRIVGKLDCMMWVKSIFINDAKVKTKAKLYQHGKVFYISLDGRRIVSTVTKYIYNRANVCMERKKSKMFTTLIAPEPREKDKRGRYT